MRIAAVAIAALLPLAPARGQQTYKWIDSEGNIHVTSTPPPDDSPSALPKPAAPSPEPAPPKTATRAEPAAPPRYEVSYLSREGNAQRVIVQVTFNRRVTAPMILDTGASSLIISYELAEKLDLLSRDDGVLRARRGRSTPRRVLVAFPSCDGSPRRRRNAAYP